MARPRRGRSGTPRHPAARTADERSPAHGGDAVHPSVWSCGCKTDLRGQYGLLLRPPDRFSANCRCQPAFGSDPVDGPAVQPSGLVYRYVLESPDRSPQELKVIEDWVVERAYRSVRGVADDSGFGGTTMQYQVLLDPARLYGYHLTVPQVMTALTANNSNAGGGFYSQGGQFYYVRGIGLFRNTDDIGNIVLGSNNGAPIRVKDVGDVVIGHAPRLGEFGYQNNDDAVEGVILMLRGEQTQNVLKA